MPIERPQGEDQQSFKSAISIGASSCNMRERARCGYDVLKRNSTRPSLISSLSCKGVGVFPLSLWRLRNVKFVLFSSSSMYWPFSTKMRACIRETPPSSPPCGVKSTSGKILLTASSRPIRTISLPLKSNSWLSASTINRALTAAGAGAEDITGAATTGAAVGAEAPVAAAVAPSMLPQFEQNDSPAGLSDPHEGHTSLPAGAAATDGAGWGAADTAAGATPDNGSPHSSQKA